MSVDRGRRGFTVIELLVVIAIIAILAAILMPVFAAARRKGQEASCLSNLKQLVTAAHTYHADHENDDTYPGIRGIRWGGSWIGIPYVECITPDGVPAGDASRTDIARYLKNAGVMKCPAEKGKVRVAKVPQYNIAPGNTVQMYTYAWNYTLNGGCPDKIDRVKRPAQLPLWVEENTDSRIEKSSTESNVINDMSFTGSDITGNRHNGYANIAFVDGHAARLQGGLRQDSATWPDGTRIFIQQ